MLAPESPDVMSVLPRSPAYADISQWQVDTKRRDAPGGGVNGQAGDHWPGPPFLTTTDMPFQWMVPPPGGAYGLRSNGNPLQTPQQPYRMGAGTLYGSNATMWPVPLAAGGLSRFVHQAGGSQSGGVNTSALQQRLLALTQQLRARGK